MTDEDTTIPTYRKKDTVVRTDDATVQGRVLDVLFDGAMLTVKWYGGDVVTIPADQVRSPGRAEPMKLPAAAPCGTCPYRTDVPSGVWDPTEYAKLPGYDEDTPYQPTQVFLCHQVDGRICAGWAGCHDMTRALGVRIALSTGDLPVEHADALMDYTTGVELFESGRAAAEHGMREIEHPSHRAIRGIAKITARHRTKGADHDA